MGTKISALTETGSAPTGAYYPLEYDNANYKISTETLRANLGGKYVADWATSHGGVTVANGATLTITHNLGTTDICVSAFANASASDVGADGLDAIIDADPGGLTYGVFITSIIDENSFVLQLADTGYGACDSSGSAIGTPFTDKFLKVVVLSAGTGLGGRYVADWAQSHGGTTVAQDATLTITHNLGTDDFAVQVFVADDASGTNAVDVTLFQSDDNTGQMLGAQVQDISTTELTIQLGDQYLKVTAGGYTKINFTDKFLQVVVLAAGTSGSDSRRAYVAFDGTAADLTASITKSFNVDSITDNGTGNYTVTFTNDIDDPIINATCCSINGGIGEISTNNNDSQIGLKSSIIVGTNRNGVSADAAYVAIIIF